MSKVIRSKRLSYAFRPKAKAKAKADAHSAAEFILWSAVWHNMPKPYTSIFALNLSLRDEIERQRK
jgi:hypothetical protein